MTKAHRVKIGRVKVKSPVSGVTMIRVINENGEGWKEAWFKRKGWTLWQRTSPPSQFP